MRIIELGGGESNGLQHFFDLATHVYMNDPVWSQASETAFESRWMSRQAASVGNIFRPVVVMSHEMPLARAVAILKAGATGVDGSIQGYVGFFECLPGRKDAALMALNKCEEILQDAGATTIQAPKVDNQLFGCQIGGFELPHVCLTQHNPPYYQGLFEANGYVAGPRVRTMYLTRESVRLETVPTALGFRIRNFDRSDLDQEIANFHRLQIEIFNGEYGYVPRSLEEDRILVERLLPIIDDELILFVENDQGLAVGIIVCLPDYYQALGGQPIDRVRIITIGILPEFACKGLGTLLGAQLMQNILKKERYKYAEASVILDDNIASQRLANRFQSTTGREFILLEKRL